MQTIKTLLLLTQFFKCQLIDAKQTNTIPKNAVKGDFNGDGKPEYIWVVQPKIDDSGEDCVGKCAIKIVCSDPDIQPVSIENAIGGKITNLGDLNYDGKDEFGVLPEWFTSCWAPYYVYTLANKHWLAAVPSFPTHCNQWEADVKPIERTPGKKGFVTIRYSVFENKEIFTRSKIVSIK